MRLRIVCLFLSAVTLLPAADRESNQTWRDWIHQSALEHRQGELAAATESGKRALTIAKESESDIHLAISHSVLGSIYRDWGRCADARANYTRAVTLFEKHSEDYRRFLFNAIANLIDTASECEEFDIAAKLYRAHRPELERYRSGPIDEATVLSIQGSISRGRKRWAEAEDSFRRSLQLLEQAPNAKPSDIAEIRSSMALMMYHRGRFEESLKESERAIVSLESVNPRSVWLPAVLNNAACVLVQLGRIDESVRMYQRSLELARDLFGEDSRNTARIMLNYAALLKKDKQSPVAEDLQKRASEAYRRSLMRDTNTVDVEELKKK